MSFINYQVYEPDLTMKFIAWYKAVYGFIPNMKQSKTLELFEAFSVAFDLGYRAPDLPTQPSKERAK